MTTDTPRLTTDDLDKLTKQYSGFMGALVHGWFECEDVGALVREVWALRAERDAAQADVMRLSERIMEAEDDRRRDRETCAALLMEAMPVTACAATRTKIADHLSAGAMTSEGGGRPAPPHHHAAGSAPPGDAGKTALPAERRWPGLGGK